MKIIDNIILVDSNPSTSELVLKAIKDSGIAEHVKVAMNGEHALLCLDHLDMYKRIKDKTTMVILNIDTPIMSGIEFLEGYKWRKYPNKEQILIAVTDATARENLEKARNFGVLNVLATPIDILEVVDLVERHFGEKEPQERIIKNKKVHNRSLSV